MRLGAVAFASALAGRYFHLAVPLYAWVPSCHLRQKACVEDLQMNGSEPCGAVDVLYAVCPLVSSLVVRSRWEPMRLQRPGHAGYFSWLAADCCVFQQRRTRHRLRAFDEYGTDGKDQSLPLLGREETAVSRRSLPPLESVHS